MPSPAPPRRHGVAPPSSPRRGRDVIDPALRSRCCRRNRREATEIGHDSRFVQANGVGPLAFRRKVDGIWSVNPVRLFYDLRNDPRRGHEQAETLRREVIGF